ncbi:MAG: acyl-CoA thioesterase [Lutibacter sp.]|uniref:acyl-CoA thioesterase n=1 Tax=Lutibacter sp. TaxID=1925666 RepID=UPI00180C024F|nr:acyl-CoA thioesterase [Lutibacter sp.]MBT8317647.1 acyl-CoA thioesterase [Lutibacter sp.]NNJ58505.1 acyl-CoA thioesterase [Lutibacter sp.]
MNKLFKTTQDSEVILTELMLPSHSNFSGKIHGGFILSLMDKAAFSSASKFSGQYCVTASVNRVDFLNSIEVGELVTLKARVNFVGRSSMVVGIRVESQNIRNGEIKHCNSSYFSMVAKDEQGKTVKVPGLIISDYDGLRRFLRSIKHIKMRNERKLEFSREAFKPEIYTDVLKNYNVKIEI